MRFNNVMPMPNVTYDSESWTKKQSGIQVP